MQYRKYVRLVLIVGALIIAGLAGLVSPVLAAPLAQSPAPIPGSPHVPTIAELTPALLSAIVAAIVSLVFRFVPGFAVWLDEHYSATGKQTFMLAVTLIVGAFIGAWNMVRDGVTEQGVILLLLTMYTALTSNQVTYSYIKPPKPPATGE